MKLLIFKIIVLILANKIAIHFIFFRT